MSEKNVETQDSPKPKRKYNRKAAIPTPPIQNLPPSPATLALESQVLELVNQRMSANSQIATAMQDAALANAKLQAAQNLLKQIEHEVNYRLALVQQMKGGPVSTFVPQYEVAVPQFESGYGVSIPQGVGSIPPQPAPMTVVEGGRRIRSESAESVRAAM